MAAGLCGVLVVAGGQPVFAAPARPYRPPALAKERSVPVSPVRAKSAGRDSVPLVTGRKAVSLPAAGAAEADVPAAPVAAGTPRVGKLPVRVGAPSGGTSPTGDANGDGGPNGAPRSRGANSAGGGQVPSRVRVEVLDRKQTERAGRNGVLLRVSRADGVAEAATVGVRLDYAAFRDVFGSDAASRLRFAALPECALTSPAAAGCQGTPIATRNDGMDAVSADVELRPESGRLGRAAASGGSGQLVGVSTAASSSSGDYRASGFAAASSWQAGGSSGGFSWSYPMRTPAVPGDEGPELGISYSSQAVDGLTAATNNQPSWVGEGFDLSQGSIERSYKPCSQDLAGSSTSVKTGDLCWALDNATLSLGDSSGELVRDDATGVWRLRSDDASRVEHLTGAINGDNDGEYWRVTTSDGTQYWFGRNRLPGWADGQAETNAVWTVPVYGNQAGEPCRGGDFDSSWCQQAWRWNLDYVVDVHGNATSRFYERETNFYGRNLDPGKGTAYTRGGWVSHIDYGLRDDNAYATPVARVRFDVADRCLPNIACDPASKANWKNWPDTPWDQWCASGQSCTDRVSPTFWTAKRLATVTTQVWDAASGRHKDVDSWSLRHTYPNPGDGTRAGLWLAGITHTGLVGGSLTGGEVVLSPRQFNNRVDGLEGYPAMNWPRLETVTNESGSVITVGYSDRDCVRGSRMPVSPDANTLRCFPAYWTPDGAEAPVLDWFHKYVVTAVSEDDRTGGAPRVVTRYEYLGDPAWRRADEDGITPESRRTWGQWRGYERVRTRTGDPGEQTTSEARYLRGMDDDELASGARRDVWVGDSAGGRIEDADAYAGMVRETITYADDGVTMVEASINDPWQSQPTATRVINGATITARHVKSAGTRVRTALDGGRGLRYTRTSTSYDGYGAPVVSADFGDEANPDDDTCTRTTYARNTDRWLLNAVARVQTTTVGCEAQPQSGADVVSDVRTLFDGGEFGAPATRGDQTAVQELVEWPADGQPRYVTTTRSTFDGYGRVVEAVDAAGAATTTAYTPATGGPVIKMVTTNALGHTNTTELDPARAMPVAKIDANDKRTDLVYDPAGRLLKVWEPSWPKARYPQDPAITYTYRLRADGANVVTTKRLVANGKFVTTYQLYDGLLRPRQTQTPAYGGGRVLTDTFYDTAGRVKLTFGAYYNAKEPTDELVAPGVKDGQIDTTKVLDQTRTVYDGAGRTTAVIFQPGGYERWRTTTGYGGDRVDVTPPAGGTATSTITDAHGHTTALRQYHGATPSGAFDATSYGLDRKGRLATVTDAAGNRWSYGYDQRGNKTVDSDPDKGTNTSVFDDAGRLSSSTDARGVTLAYGYDTLGRKTGLYEGSTSGVKRAEWTYDTLAQGVPTTSTRYVGTNAYTVAATGYNDRYQPTGTRVTIPAVEGNLAGSYTFLASYETDGSPSTLTYPAVGGLRSEKVLTTYDALGSPKALYSSAADAPSYVTSSSYTAIGLLERVQLSRDEGKTSVWQTYSYEPGTNRTRKMSVGRQLGTPNSVGEVAYAYEDAGAVTQIIDQPTGSSITDTQCFEHDYLQRLTAAWTPTGDCLPDPNPKTLSGPAPYYQSFDYDLTGNRTTKTDHTTSGKTTTTYTYPAAGATQPHAVQTVTTERPTGSAITTGFGYDATGNTTRRPTATGDETLTWDAEGHLATETGSDQRVTSYLYDADGNRLLRRTSDATTAFLPGTDLRLDTETATVAATRYYSHAGTTVASRTAGGLTWLMSDHQGTAQYALDAGTHKVTVRRQDPFGAARGTSVAWPNSKGFLGGETDPSGLTHLGAREYEPGNGRFMSVDPILDTSDPQQMNGYAYANSNPVTTSDPSGLSPEDAQWEYNHPNARNDAAKDLGWARYGPPTSIGGTNSGNSGSGKGNGGSGKKDRSIASRAWGAAWGGTKDFGKGAWQSVKQPVVNASHTFVQDIKEHHGPAYSTAHAWMELHSAFDVGTVMGAFSSATGQARAMSAAASGDWETAVRIETTQTLTAATILATEYLGGAAMAQLGRSGRAADGAATESTAPAKPRVPDCPDSFTATTLVLLADGTTKPIGQITIGDTVLATNPETGQTAPQTVTALHRNQDTELTDLTLTTGNDATSTGTTANSNTQVIHTTQHHPFWNATTRQWQHAGDLQSGTALLTANQQTAQVVATHNFTHAQTMHNLTIDDTHTYYVIAGTTPVLVHNCPNATLLGRKADIEDYIASKPGGGFDADFLNIRGKLAGGKKGVGGWNWTRNKQFIDKALDSGKEVRLVTDPDVPIYRKGNAYQRELRYLKGKGYGWEQVDDYWRVVRVRP